MAKTPEEQIAAINANNELEFWERSFLARARAGDYAASANDCQDFAGQAVEYRRRFISEKQRK